MVICCDYMCLCVAIICAIFVATKCGYVLRLHVVICCDVRNVCCD